MITAPSLKFVTLEDSTCYQQFSEKKPKVVNQFGGEIFKNQDKNPNKVESELEKKLDLDDGKTVKDTNHETPKDEGRFSYYWKIVEKVVEYIEPIFNTIYELGYEGLRYSFGFIKCSIKCFTDFAFVNLIRELNIIRQLSINIGAFSSSAQQPNVVNNYYIVIISGVQGSNCKDEYLDDTNIDNNTSKCGILEPLLKNYTNLGVFPLKV